MPETLKSNRPSRRSIIQYDFLCDLHGLTSDEALARVKNAISVRKNAVIMINHGKGSGTLRSAVRGFLSRNPAVKKVQHGENLGLPEGDGVTMAEV